MSKGVLLAEAAIEAQKSIIGSMLIGVATVAAIPFKLLDVLESG